MSDGTNRKGIGGGAVFAIILTIIAVLLAASLLILTLGLGRSGSLARLEAYFESGFTGAGTENPPRNPIPTKQPPASIPAPLGDASGEQAPPFSFSNNPIPDIVDRVSPSVVGIINYVESSSPIGGNRLEIHGSGSGFVITGDNYIITNAHVVDGADVLSIVTTEGIEYEATLIGADVTTDVAVLLVTDANLPALPVGSSQNLRVGDFVLAIGNPLDSYELSGTVTMGIISGLARSINIDGFTNTYLQTDAAINPGNSGGPLLNMNGEVIGVNSAKTIFAGYDDANNPISAEGIGFALPIDEVINIANSLISDGGIERPGIGVSVKTITEENAQQLETIAGVYVAEVTAGGPADQAGIKIGDVIVKLNDLEINAQDDLITPLRQCNVGDVISITVYRNGSLIELTVTVGDMNRMP